MANTTNLNIKKIDRLPDISSRYAQDDEIINTTNVALDTIDTQLTNKLDKTGDASNTIVAFTEATVRENVITGEKANIRWGKVKKFFTDLKAVAFSGSYTDLINLPNLALKLNTTGDAKDTTVTFTEATARDPLLSGDKLSILMGKLMKMYNSFKAIVFSGHAKDVEITDTNNKYTSINVDGALDEVSQTLEQITDKSNMLRDDIDNTVTILSKVLSWVNTSGYKQGTAFVYNNVTDNPAVQHGFVTFKSKKETIHQIEVSFYSLSTGKTYKNTIDRTSSAYLFTFWKEIATTDKIDILWEGSTTTIDQPLPLTNAITNYNRLIITVGDFNELTYIHDFTPDKLVDSVVDFPASTGTVKLTFSGKAVTINVANRTLRKIVGISSSL